MTPEEEEDVELAPGMPVRNEKGEELGTLAGLLIEEEEEGPEFLVLTAAGKERLVPFEAARRVDDGALVVDVPVDVVANFPTVREEEDPTDAEVELAYQVYDQSLAERDAA